MAAAEQNRVGRYLDLWLAECEQAVDSRDMSPRTLRERQRWCDESGHIGGYWRERSVHGITRPELTGYLNWLSRRQGRNKKPLSGKTRWNIVAAFHRFCGWRVEEEVIGRVPNFRWPKKHRKVAPILSMRSQQLVLEAIPEEARGVYLVMARLLVRPSEAVELRTSDLRDGWINVSRARSDRKIDAPAWRTKTGEPKTLPVPDDVASWIERHSPREPSALLFPNPRTGGPWSEASLRRQWGKACREVGLEGVGIYAATKHSTATELRRRGVPLDVIQRAAGHADRRSTELYAQLADSALVEALAPGSGLARDGRSEPAEGSDTGQAAKAETGSNLAPVEIRRIKSNDSR